MSPAEKLASKKKPRKESRPGRSQIWPKCRLLEKRTELRLTIREVADAVGITNAAVSVIERGSDPMLTNARNLAAFFGMTVEEMWPS